MEQSEDPYLCSRHLVLYFPGARSVEERSGAAMPEITDLLTRLNGGDKSALDSLIPLVYQELHRIARGYLQRETPGQTLQPTSLIHEAYLRMVKQSHPEYANRANFYGIAARIMRQILVDHARSRHAAKRTGGEKLGLSEVLEFGADSSITVLAVNEALERLALEDGLKSRIVEMRFFAGMTADEISACVNVPVHTVHRQLRLAQAWLRKEVGR
jgi:RNA polymerase sigma-70 factor (ECF subfamily)